MNNKPHQTRTTHNVEWYTPQKYVEAVRKVMGSIDLDPASNIKANKIVNAKNFFNWEMNGLYQEWYGNVFLNPPYARGIIDKWIDKLISQLDNITEFVLLINNATDTQWFQKIIRHSKQICFVNGRIEFINGLDQETSKALQGQVFLYNGGASFLFDLTFSDFGYCRNLV